MDITLVTSSYDKVVHGTDNDKKTGCGINLLKPENVTRFHRTSRMTDLKEITCEKCKASLAKKLIKADKKEMALLLKEEKKREKLGYGDEGIVPLGNTTARITKDPDARRKEEEARQKAAAEARAAAEAKRKAEEEAAQEAIEYYNTPAQNNAQPEDKAPAGNIPGTGIPMDESLAQFAINVPHEEENAPAAAAAEEDDFLAQFAIQKPDAEAAPVQDNTVAPEDDFLAQFAIPAPQNSTLPGGEPAPVNYGTEPEEMDGLDFNYNQQPVQPAPVYSQPEQPMQGQGEEDIMQMFSIDNNNAQEPVYGQPPYGQPVYEQPVYGGDQPVYYTEDGQIVQPYIDPAQQYIQPDAQYIQPDMVYPAESLQGAEYYNADQMYGYDETIQQGVPVSAPVYPQYDENMPKEMEELDIPAIDDISAPIPEAIPSAENIGAPAFDEISTVGNAPVIDDISMVQETAAPGAVPTVEDIAVPAFDEIPAAGHAAAPIIDDISAAEDLTAPMLDDMPVLGDAGGSVIEDISSQTFNEPLMAEEEYDNIMSDYNYVAPGAGANTNEAEQPKQQAQQPQIIKVPQLAGYDANNQPVYKYVQMKLVGRDQNGQPVYVPVGAPQAGQAQRPAAPAQQTAAQAQRAAAAPVQQGVQAQRPVAPVQQGVQRPVAPVQQAPVKSPVPRKPVQQSGIPSANISKIAVNPHSKSTSQAFINAIASSKDYADKNLIETQGLKANSPVLTSVEDVLSTMGDESAKRQMQAKAQAQQNVPVFDEYKAPQKNSYRGSSAPRQQSSSMNDARYMTKAELKAKKKQDKIDAKFKKEMSKRGF
ncbi:hypothetical protein [Ruminococcus flavefaciens]|uniref:Uncharacterized protein n=1 Tax=Ruminococcus flavefaciens TaxID=1265 RepID=A0A1M7KX63_RUMFL|nr:hypothetical protein [Ruminococcus flavefaciens]SHM70197.1 hypothetical protein SAMN04487860_110103 [Ruminococcus flavefaciens]